MKTTTQWSHLLISVQIIVVLICLVICIDRATGIINEHITRRTAMVMQNLRESDVHRNKQLNEMQLSLILLENAVLKKEGDDATKPTE